MRLSLGETDQTNLTANVLADLGLDSDTENNDELGIGNIDVNLDTLLDEDYVSCTNVVGSLLAASGTGFDATEPEASPVLPSGTGSNAYEPEGYPNQPSGTGFNATEPEVNPNQPSGTGYNAIESEVRPVLNLHDEACEDEVTTDLAQPPVSEARSITCSLKNYVPRKDIPRVRAPTPLPNRRPQSPTRKRAPMKDISHRQRDRYQTHARAQSSRESRWERAAANRACRPLEPVKSLQVSVPLPIVTDNSYMNPERVNFIKRVYQLGSCSLCGYTSKNYTRLSLHVSSHLSAYFCNCGFGSSQKTLVVKHVKGKSVREPVTAKCTRDRVYQVDKENYPRFLTDFQIPHVPFPKLKRERNTQVEEEDITPVVGSRIVLM